jgi:hypothetical protein
LPLQKPKVLDKDRYNVSRDDIRQCFETLSLQTKLLPSRFVWNADETRVRCPKQTSPPELIVAINIKLGSVTISEVRDEAQLTLLTTISVFRDFTRALIISKLTAFEKTLRAAKNYTQVIIM